MKHHTTSSLFDSATFRLTAWYMTILIVLSLLFSFIVYSIASHEVERAVGPRHPGGVEIFIENAAIDELRRERIEESDRNIITNLVVFNIFTITAGGAVSYLLARRTLSPIKDALESQARFSSDAAHELRTPLAVMQSEIEVALRDKSASKTMYGEILESNLDEVHRLHTLTDRLLMLASSQPLPLTEVQIEDVAADSMTRAIPLAQAKKIKIKNTVSPALVTAHAESLTDVLGILIENAIKYSPENSTIVLSSEVRDAHVIVEVIDKGIGISPQDIERIFERFYRVDISRSKINAEGHGLGLAIAKQLAELQHGTLTVKSEPDKGSVFRVTLQHVADK